MKTLLLALSLIGFCVSMIFSWITGGVWYGLLVTVISIVCICLSMYSIKNRARVKWWIVIVLLIFSLFMLKHSVISMVCKEFEPIFDKYGTEVKVDSEPEATNDECDGVDEGVATVNEVKLKQENNQPKDTSKKTIVTKVVEKVVEKPVEKVVTEYVEVPVVEYVEVQTPETNTNEQVSSPTISTPMNPQYGYTGDPTMMNYGYNNGINYGGDPTINNNYLYQSIEISGDKYVIMGESIPYTITGVSSISESRLNLPNGVSVDKIRGNKVYLTFDEVGWYSIGYGNATINVAVEAE